MATRNLLHKNKLDDFKRWLVKDGWKIEPTKGLYEVLRARKGNKRPLIIYARDNSKEHVTVQARDVYIVKAYLRDRR